jgi:hypothetical protein
MTRRARFTPTSDLGSDYFAAALDPTYTTMSNRAVCKYHGSSSVCVPTKVALDDVPARQTAALPEKRERESTWPGDLLGSPFSKPASELSAACSSGARIAKPRHIIR